MEYQFFLNFSRYWGVDVDVHDGRQCLMIPIKENCITIGNKSIYQRFDLHESGNLPYGATHYALKHLTKNSYLKNEEKIRHSIMGNLFPRKMAIVFDKNKPLHGTREDEKGKEIEE